MYCYSRLQAIRSADAAENCEDYEDYKNYKSMHFNKKWPSKRASKNPELLGNRPAIDLTGSGLFAERR